MAILVIVIVVVAGLFVIQDLDFQTNTDHIAPDPNENPDLFNSAEPEPTAPKTTDPIIPPKTTETTPPPKPVETTPTQPKVIEEKCDSSYPDVCIAPYPPDLDCGEISHKNFKVLAPDPHGFDGDKDGIGCES